MPDPIPNVDAYIAGLGSEVRPVIEKTRSIVLKTAPEAEESISYGMPTYKANGLPLLYLAAWKRHISLHAIPTLGEPLESEVEPYRTGKDTVRFQLKEPIPYELIERIVKALRAN